MPKYAISIIPLDGYTHRHSNLQSKPIRLLIFIHIVNLRLSANRGIGAGISSLKGLRISLSCLLYPKGAGVLLHKMDLTWSSLFIANMPR
jgi:hypothetical protein